MKIAIISPSDIPSRRANSIQTMKMCQAFVQLGHEVKLFVPGTGSDANWEDLQSHYGIKSKFQIAWITHLPKLKKYDFSVNALIASKQWGANLIFTRLLQIAALAGFAKIPTILELHDVPSGKNGPKMLRKFVNSRFASGLICITNVLLTDIRNQYKSNKDDRFYKVLPDGVDLARFDNFPTVVEAREKLEMDPKFTVGYTGHLYPGRGGSFILEIAKLSPKINFLLVGGEPEDIHRLEEESAMLGLENVNFVGFVDNEKLPLYQAASDVLLMPYQKTVAGSSGGDIAKYLSPMKLFEYLASGRVVISSDLPVFQEVLGSTNSIILSTDNAKKWADEISLVQENDKLRMTLGENARTLALQYDWKERAAKIIKLISE